MFWFYAPTRRPLANPLGGAVVKLNLKGTPFVLVSNVGGYVQFSKLRSNRSTRGNCQLTATKAEDSGNNDYITEYLVGR